MPTPSGGIAAYIADYIAANVAGFFLGGTSTPSWVLPGATVDMDFANGLYFGGTLANLLTISRASSKTDLLPASASGLAYNTFLPNVLAVTPTLGVLIEEARTNVLLNSTAPVTQTTASLGTGVYTLWVNGSGSATSSAGSATITGAGAATNGTPNVFTVTVAGTVTITVSGSLNAFQCELGAFGTSLIVTAGATATRAADNIIAAGALLALFQATSGSFVESLAGLPSAANQAFANFIGFNTQATFCQNGGTNTLLFSADSTGSNGISFNIGGGTTSSAFKAGASWAPSSRVLAVNNPAVVTSDANSLINAAVTSVSIGSFGPVIRNIDTYLKRLTVFNSQIPSATLKALTV